MLYLDLRPVGRDARELSESLRREGVLTLGFPGPEMRLVTHRDVSSDDTDRALKALQRVLAA